MSRERGERIEDRNRGWRMEDGGWRMEDGGWRINNTDRMNDKEISLKVQLVFEIIVYAIKQ
jgi:hypothetical protein